MQTNKYLNRLGKLKKKLLTKITSPFIDFMHEYFIQKPYIYGDKKRVFIGERVSLVNTLINTASGNVYIGDDTIFGHNCVIATGIHEFEKGMRKKIYYKENFSKDIPETPLEGYDIKIGKGCWITSNVTIIGNVTIGDNVVICAGSIVTKNIPSGVIVAGIPAKIIKEMVDN